MARAHGAAAMAAAAIFFCAPALAATPAASAGAFHNAVLGADGLVRTWGEDLFGQLGLGRLLFATRPTAVNGAPPASAIAAGFDHSVMLAADRSVWAWGLIDKGVLGDGNSAASLYGRSTPQSMIGVANVAAISTGSDHTLLLMTDGTVRATGLNANGQIGDGTFVDRLVAVPVAGLSSVRAVVAGDTMSIAIRNDGSAWWWGQVLVTGPGLGNQPTPIPVPGISGVVAAAPLLGSPGATITSGTSLVDPTVVALKSDGTVWIWSVRQSPQQVAGLTQVSQIAGGGGMHALALKQDGTVWAWGNNESGQLGLGNRTGTTTPTQVPGLSAIASIRAGPNFSAALRSDGSVVMWGDNLFGQLGDGTRNTQRLSPVAVNGLTGATALALGDTFTLALLVDGSIRAWGNNEAGQLGDGAPNRRVTPTIVPNLTNVAAVSAGPSSTVVAKDDGTVWYWGTDSIGFGGVSTPTQVAGLSQVIAVVADSTNLALKQDGSVWAWGAATGSTVPVQVPGLAGIRTIGRAGHAIRNDGTLFAISSSLPLSATPVAGVSDVIAVDSSVFFTIALTRDGRVFTFGRNPSGQLGDGTTIDHSAPAQVSAVPSAIAISAGQDFAVAIAADGTAWTWGDNTRAQLGDGSVVSHPVPRPIAYPPGASQVSSGGFHTIALTRDGVVWTWGDNSAAQLGDGTYAIGASAVVVRHEGGTGSVAGTDWFLTTASAQANAIPAEKVPAVLGIVSGEVAATSKVNVAAQVTFRASDIGNPIHVFAYAPLSVVKRAPQSKDTSPCVLAQVGSDGFLHQLSPSQLQAYIANVLGAQSQAISIVNNIDAANLAGATICVGSGATGTQSTDPHNNHCMASVPGAIVCVPPTLGPPANVPSALSGLWWKSDESGWGIHFTQRRNIVFAAWYTYNANGNPKWYVSTCNMPSGSTGTNGTCNGTLFEVSGPAFFGATFNPGLVNAVNAGSLQVSFQGADTASMTYTAAGQTRTLPITRQPLATGATPPAFDYTDLWWNPNESGWGLAVTQQFGTMFLAWYVYDNAGQPTWYVATCTLSVNTCAGSLLRTTGPAFGPTFDATQVHSFTAGTVSIVFTDANNATLSFTVNGVSASKTITRQLF